MTEHPAKVIAVWQTKTSRLISGEVGPWLLTSIAAAALMLVPHALFGRQTANGEMMIVSDNQLWTDYGCMSQEHIETLNLDKLLAERGFVSHQSGKWWEGGFRRGGDSTTHHPVARLPQSD